MGIKKIATDTQKEILDGMLARIEDVQVTTKRDPVSPEIIKAIESGTSEVKKAASKAITANRS